MNAPVPLPSAAEPAWLPDGFTRALGGQFHVQQPSQPLPEAHWVARCDRLADELGWAGWMRHPEALQLLAGNVAPPSGSLATVYSGHQFGVWAGQLGDGRALLIGEADTPLGRVEVQLKGSGLTPFSRMGDGRAVLRSSIREFLCSEAMHALGVPTTRALAVVGSPLPVRRETVETAAVVTRVAPSFLRFGHFEHFAHSTENPQALRHLTDATISRYFPELEGASSPYTALLEAVARRTAELMAHWQAVGFCHGVMNTDNMSILGLTIDYGPFGFLDVFDPGHICNHTDHQGRYAYARQPNVAFWNLHALAQALLPLITDSDAALAALEPYKTAFPNAMLARLSAKLGLATVQDGDQALIDDLLRRMAADQCDFTITFRRLGEFSSAPDAVNAAVRDLFRDREAFDTWASRYAARLRHEASVDVERRLRMNRSNPKFILRNHLAEVAIRDAQAGDFGETQRLLELLAHPYDDQPGVGFDTAPYAGFPPEWAQSIEVSCSS